MTSKDIKESISDFSAFETLEGKSGLSLVVLGDHAMRHLPGPYGHLGLPEAEFERHIAYDIGVEWFLRRLYQHLNAPTVMARFSRLLIDPNRGMEDPTIIRQIYDGTIIPANYPLSEEERGFRIAAFHKTYHDEIQRVIDQTEANSGKPPLIISMHSFTAEMKGQKRPWHVSILWDSDPRCKDALLKALATQPGWHVGDNQPYDGALHGDTMYTHCSKGGLAHGLIEIRQDLIDTKEKAEKWADDFAPMLEAIAQMPDMHERKYFGSRVGPLRADDAERPIMTDKMDAQTQLELEAAAYRRLRDHLQKRTDVQNIDLMILGGFCRNCLSNWMQEAAHEKGLKMDKSEARALIYGMPYETWRDQYQTEATPEQMAALKAANTGH